MVIEGTHYSPKCFCKNCKKIKIMDEKVSLRNEWNLALLRYAEKVGTEDAPESRRKIVTDISQAIATAVANREKEIAEEVEKKNEKLPYTPDCTGEQIIYNENHMSLIKHAERELRLAGFFDKDSDYEGALGKAVMELIKVFSKQGHSGFSANRVVSLFEKVARYENLLPLTGEDSEWNDISDLNGGTLQNNRVSSVFKEKETGRAYYIDAIVWRTQNGGYFTGSADDVSSRQYIKSFPFTPKTFYVDVIEEEVKKDDWVFHIKDNEQLMPVFEYYEEKKWGATM